MGSFVDGVDADEGIHRANGATVVASCIHMLVDTATADVNHRSGCCFSGIREVGSERVAVVGVTRAAIHRAVDTTTGDVEGLEASHIDGAVRTIGTGKHILTKNGAVLGTRNIDSGGTIRSTHLAAAKHVALHFTAADADGGAVACAVVSHSAVLTAAIDRAIHHATLHVDGGALGYVGTLSACATLTSAVDVGNRAAFEIDGGVATDRTQLTATIHIGLDCTARDVDYGVFRHAGTSTITCTKHTTFHRTATDVDRGIIGNGTAGVGTAIHRAVHSTVLHGNSSSRSTLGLVGTAEHAARNGEAILTAAQHIHFGIGFIITIVTSTIYRTSCGGIVGYDNE